MDIDGMVTEYFKWLEYHPGCSRFSPRKNGIPNTVDPCHECRNFSLSRCYHNIYVDKIVRAPDSRRNKRLFLKQCRKRYVFSKV